MFTRSTTIAFVVADIEDAMDRFEANYDMTLVTRDEVTGAFSMDVALYNAGDNIVELISPLGDEGWTYDVLREQGEGWFHIAFEVEDIRESMEESRVPRYPREGRRASGGVRLGGRHARRAGHARPDADRRRVQLIDG